jgi:endonuclease YncB( thermonuclease family)
MYYNHNFHMVKILLMPVLALFLCLTVPAAANELLAVKNVPDAETLELSDGALVHLADVKAPYEAALAEKAHVALAQLSEHKNIRIEELGLDRRGRKIARVYADKIWLEAALVKAGLVFVYATSASDRADELLQLEAEARNARRGLWEDPAYRDTPAEEATKRSGHFAFVTGEVVEVARHRDKTYINFGPDWRTAFTIILDARMQHALKKNGIDTEDLRGKRLRVRGLVESYFGPAITPVHAAQVELLNSN